MVERGGEHEETRKPKPGVRWLALVALIAVTLSLVSCFGCASTIIPPLQVREPTAVYLADYGRHASLILPRTETELVEYTFGEWQWYALNHTGFFSALRALLLPSQGALGRRHLDGPPGDIWWEDLALLNLYEIEVEREKVEALLASLDDRWEAAHETRVYNPVHDLDFVRDRQVYHLISNSNPTTARWLKELGCTVRGPAMISEWRIAER